MDEKGNYLNNNNKKFINGFAMLFFQTVMGYLVASLINFLGFEDQKNPEQLLIDKENVISFT